MNPFGYRCMGTLAGVLMLAFNFIYGTADMTFAMPELSYALILMVPILCMRSMAEDRHNKTDMFYLSLPMKTSSVVLGKYFAMLTVYAIPCAVLCVYPLVLGGFGEIRYLTAYLSILLYLLLGAALIAVCQFMSSLTDNLVIAAVLGVLAVAVLLFSPFLSHILPPTAIASFIGCVVLALLLAGVAFLSTHNLNVTAITAAVAVVPLSVVYILSRGSFENLFPSLLQLLSPFAHFATFCQFGTFSVPSLILLLSYPVLFVFLTVQSADKKRWD